MEAREDDRIVRVAEALQGPLSEIPNRRLVVSRDAGFCAVPIGHDAAHYRRLC